MNISIVLDHTCKLYAPIIVQNPRSKRWHVGISERMDSSLRITCIHWVLMLDPVLGETSTLITISSKLAPQQRDGWTKDVVQVLIASTHDYFRDTCLWLLVTWMLSYIFVPPFVSSITWLISFMQRPYIHPYAYGDFSTTTYFVHTCCYYCYYCFTVTAVFTLLLLFSHCYY